MNWLHKFFNLREDPGGDAPKPFLEHLEELRIMLFKMLAAIVCGTIIAFLVSRRPDSAGDETAGAAAHRCSQL